MLRIRRPTVHERGRAAVVVAQRCTRDAAWNSMDQQYSMQRRRGDCVARHWPGGPVPTRHQTSQSIAHIHRAPAHPHECFMLHAAAGAPHVSAFGNARGPRYCLCVCFVCLPVGFAGDSGDAVAPSVGGGAGERGSSPGLAQTPTASAAAVGAYFCSRAKETHAELRQTPQRVLEHLPASHSARDARVHTPGRRRACACVRVRACALCALCVLCG